MNNLHRSLFTQNDLICCHIQMILKYYYMFIKNTYISHAHCHFFISKFKCLDSIFNSFLITHSLMNKLHTGLYKTESNNKL